MSLRAPLPSPDNRTVFAIGDQRQGELVRYDTSRAEFAPFLGGISAEGVSFSGDGQWVAFVRYPEGDLWRSRIDGSDRRQLTFTPFAAVMPSWSPDGRTLAFTGREEVDRHWQIYLVSVDGANPQPVTAEGHDQFLGSWSPDGSFLAVGGIATDATTSVRLIELASRKVTTLPESAGYVAPTFSPDGKHVYAGAINPKRLMDFDLGMGRWSEIFRGTFKYWAFSHDFRFLYFDRGLGGNPGIYRVPMAGGGIEKVASLEHVRRTMGLWGPWFDLGPDDSPILLRNISSQQIYALALTRR